MNLLDRITAPEKRDFSAYDSLWVDRKHVGRLNYEDISYVAKHMRQKDYEEIYVGSGYANPIALAAHIYKTALFGFIFRDTQGTPQAVISFHASIPGVWSVGAFATNEWDSVFTSVSIYGRRLAKKVVVSGMVRRLEARSLASYSEAHKWLEWLGAHKECELKDWGLGRETFYLYTWKLSDYEQEHI